MIRSSSEDDHRGNSGVSLNTIHKPVHNHIITDSICPAPSYNMKTLNTRQLRKFTRADINGSPIAITAYGQPYCYIVPVSWIDENGVFTLDNLRDSQLEDTGLSIAEKRGLLREFVHSSGISHQAKAKYLELDSRLAGHFAPEKQEIVVSGDSQAGRLKDAVKQALLEVIEERDRMITKHLPSGESALLSEVIEGDIVDDSPHHEGEESVASDYLT